VGGVGGRWEGGVEGGKGGQLPRSTGNFFLFSFCWIKKKKRYLETEGTSDLFALGYANGKIIRVCVLNFDQKLPWKKGKKNQKWKKH
jgi:hypothetical protein